MKRVFTSFLLLLFVCVSAFGQVTQTYLGTPPASGSMESGGVYLRYSIGEQEVLGLDDELESVVFYPVLMASVLPRTVDNPPPSPIPVPPVPVPPNPVKPGVVSSQLLALTVSPNPCGTHAVVAWPQLGELVEHLSLVVLNQLGQAVYSTYLSCNESCFNLDVHSLPSGIYFIRVQREDGQVLGATRIVVYR